MAEPSLSIVIAAWPDLTGLEDCLEALCRQRDPSTECIVASTLAPPEQLVARFPWVCWSQAAPDGLIPHLWGLGMASARGDLLAITTAHFTPAPDWVRAIRSAQARWPGLAVGGRLEPPRGRSPVSWAIYFLRYSSYLRYEHEQPVPDVAGDNASYKRLVLQAFPNLLREGFWELTLHRRLWAEGQGPVFVPAIRVTQCHSFGFWAFFRQRFQHGRHFGGSRAQGWGPVRRLVAGAASPLIPVLFLSKILLRVLRSRQYLDRFLIALPALLCFLLAWSAGEGCGYLFASGQRSEPSPQRGHVPFPTSDSSTSTKVPLCP
jgi:hypothetical protein